MRSFRFALFLLMFVGIAPLTRAATVQFQTTGTFASTGTGTSYGTAVDGDGLPTGGSSNATLTFTGVTSPVFTLTNLVPATGIEYGNFAFQLAPGQNSFFNDTLTLDITQLIPGGSGSTPITVDGFVQTSASGVAITFGAPVVIVNGTTKTIYTFNTLDLLKPPAQDNGVTEVTGKLTLTALQVQDTPTPAAALGGIGLLSIAGLFKRGRVRVAA